MERVMTPEARSRLIADMAACEQTAGMSVLQHGEMVATYYRDIIEHIRWSDIDIPQNVSTDGTYRPLRLRVKTTMTITDADQDGSPDIRSMIAAATLIREMKPSGVEPDVTFNHEGGIHLSWTGDGWEIEAGVEHDGRFDWVCETKDRTVRQSDGLIRPQDAVVTIQRLLTDIVQDGEPMALQSEGVAHV